MSVHDQDESSIMTRRSALGAARSRPAYSLCQSRSASTQMPDLNKSHCAAAGKRLSADLRRQNHGGMGWRPEILALENGSLIGETSKENQPAQNTFLIWRKGTPGNFELKAGIQADWIQ